MSAGIRHFLPRTPPDLFSHCPPHNPTSPLTAPPHNPTSPLTAPHTTRPLPSLPPTPPNFSPHCPQHYPTSPQTDA
ncbi:hypothetical protein Pmani_000091 [Petrolisthes manimaculis]|uniref:Uncharacterized protein n=1 Tax=Petrolisthes manimaculis TaxID=1843537 RepID=A0AAE1UTC7_9EUCA|nr:hypothetical protein Pmani_000091 [Petrolisthes manimaculis]